MSTEKLAIEGGKPVRTQPFPHRHPFDLQDAAEILDALNSQTLFFPGGKKVYEFQQQFSQLYGVKHGVTSTSGTSVIHVAIGAINPDPGDAIIAVHCWGQPVDMDRIMEIARKHDLYVIEDCAQAHLTRYKGKLVGTISHVGIFSLQDSQHLQCGDGGVTITNDDELGKRAALFVDKGCRWSEDRKYRLLYTFIAPCYRMTELQGAILLSQLKKLERIVKTRQRLGDLLTKLLADLPGIHPPVLKENIDHSYWSYPLRIDQEVLGVSPQEFATTLSAEGIPVGGSWIGKPLYLFEALAQQITYGSSHCPFDCQRTGRKIQYIQGMCPNAKLALEQLRTLLICESFTEEDILDVAKAVRKVAEHYLNCKAKEVGE